MSEIECSLTDLKAMSLHAAETEIATWQGHQALKLVNGLAVLQTVSLSDTRIEVEIGADGAAFPGVAFRIVDRANYELGYAVPHASELWDAIQYDPVFHACNTWQIYHGPAYQKAAVVPTGQWFTLRVDVKGDQAAFAVNDQPPLVVPRLMHPQTAGAIGVWTYLPAYFRDLRVTACPDLPAGLAEAPHKPADCVEEWFIEGFGRVGCEPNGILNLNRCLPVCVGEVTLTRQFELAASEQVQLSFGFSDELVLLLDEQIVFEGTQTFANMNSYEARGYVEPGQHALSRSLEPGVHTLTARLKTTEYFGWGLVLSLQGRQIRLLPVI